VPAEELKGSKPEPLFWTFVLEGKWAGFVFLGGEVGTDNYVLMGVTKTSLKTC
jgi:hypothetical protein